MDLFHDDGADDFSAEIAYDRAVQEHNKAQAWEDRNTGETLDPLPPFGTEDSDEGECAEDLFEYLYEDDLCDDAEYDDDDDDDFICSMDDCTCTPI